MGTARAAFTGRSAPQAATEGAEYTEGLLAVRVAGWSYIGRQHPDEAYLIKSDGYRTAGARRNRWPVKRRKSCHVHSFERAPDACTARPAPPFVGRT